MSICSRPQTRTRRYFKGLVVPRGMWDGASERMQLATVVSINVIGALALFYQWKSYRQADTIEELELANETLKLDGGSIQTKGARFEGSLDRHVKGLCAIADAMSAKRP